MKNKNSFIFKGLISLMLSLVMICGTAVTSLSAVTRVLPEDESVVVSDTVSADDSVDDAAPYGVAEGILTEEPASNDVLELSLSDEAPAEEAPAAVHVSREKGDVEMAETGAKVTGSLDTTKTYRIGSETSNYYLEYASGNTWKVRKTENNSSTYYYYDYSWQWKNSYTAFTLVSNSASGATLSYQTSGWGGNTTYYLTYNTNTGVTAVTYSSTVYLYLDASTETPTEAETQTVTEAPIQDPTESTSPSQQHKTARKGKTLYFTNNANWTNVYAYLWKDGASPAVQNAAYPGVKLNKLGTNDYNEDIYSVTFDPDVYDSVIFNNGVTDSNNNSFRQTVTVPTATALAEGSGIYCARNGDAYVYHDTANKVHEVGYYLHGIDYSKKIEKLSGSGHGDYDYRVHLTLDGRSLVGTSTETTEGNKGTTGIALLVEVSQDFIATWSNNKSKKTVIEEIVNSYLQKYKDSKVKISIILVKGSLGVKYNDESQAKIVSKWNDYSNVNLEGGQIRFESNFMAGLMTARDYLEESNTENKSIVFITETESGLICNASGYTDNSKTGDTARKEIVEYVPTFLNENSELSLYVLDVSNESTGAHKVPVAMGEKAREMGRGDIYEATDAQTLTDSFDDIITTILPGDQTNKITVSDKLSGNVSVLGTNGNFSAVLKITGKEDQNVTSEVSYNPTTKTFTFNHADAVDGPFIIEITYDIKTADGVDQDTDTYGATGYPNTGDADTDYGENNTSSNQPGYYSNDSATISYSLNGDPTTGTFKHPVVQAPENTPVQGKYIFKYIDRYNTERTVEVPVSLNSSEKNGYSGNNYRQNVPTFLWTAEAQNLFTKNPLVTAALRVDGNAELENGETQKDVSVYKHTIEWDNLNTDTYTAGSNVSFNSEDHTVTVTANTPEMTFTFNYKIMKNGYVLKERAATDIPYGRAVTFHPQYSDTSKYAYIDDTIPSEGFSYWSADEEGNIPITTNLTFGMLIRGDYMHDGDDETIVTVYAQYNKAPKNDWNPLIEEAKLTHTVEDIEGSKIDWLYLDYMTNYLSKDGSVVKDMIKAGNDKIRYGLIAVKHDGTKTPDQAKMIKIAQAMITKNKQSAYLDSNHQTIAYHYEYGSANTEVKPISNFNRVLYTLRTDTEKAENHTFSAIAYITVDGTNYFYSEVNSDIVVHDLIEN